MSTTAVDPEEIARELFGVHGSATPLHGEHDLNFRLEAAGSRYVLKLHHPDADATALDLQDAVLEALASEPGVPRLRGSRAWGERRARLLSWIDGRPWAEGGGDMASLGRVVARVDRALAGFAHPAMCRHHRWDLRNAAELAPWAERLDPAMGALVAPVLAAPAALTHLPHQVIHNDANEHNVLVGEDGTVVGLIDFGDAVWSARVCGLAVAGAYAMQRQPDPVRAVVPVVRGYHEVAPLSAAELAVLYHLMRTRLAMSVCMAAAQHSADPGNDYLLVSQRGVTEVLEQLAGEDPDLAHFRFRDACGYEASPKARRVRQFFESGAARPAAVIRGDLAAARVLDLSAGMPPADGPAIGRYDEERTVYTAPEFRTPGGRWRTRHMATDLFAPAGTPVFAPLDGVVERRENRNRRGDYGGLLVLRHATDEGLTFWTLHGHLDPETLVEGEVRAGEEIARLGAPAVNGGWEPHLHLQLFTDLVADLPGVALSEEADLWRSVCPDPNLLLELRGGDAAHPPRPDIADRRRTVMSAALSLAYREPLHIVRGRGAHLYDADGRPFLDLVNNVAHVGHCHPRVVAAGHRQMAELNTNTRYLHGSVVDYARRLASTLPDALHVCFFVNSGSEANDLALRLATAHTRREDVVVLEHAYHGHLSSQVALSPYKFDRPGGRGRPRTTHVAALPTAAGALESLREQLAAAPPAAFFAESLQGCGGQVVYPAGYLREAFAAVREAGGVCVSDEVQTGFGRIGEHFWGFELDGVVPDIVTMGKPIGNGHPLAAVVTTPEVAASFVTGMEYFNTFGGNPVSSEIGLAVLDVIRDERLQARARAMGDRLLAGLAELTGRHEAIRDVRGHGLFLGVELSGGPLAARVKEGLKARGVLISTDGPDDAVLKIKPPLVIAQDDCDLFLAALDEVLA
jgi:4-aminobutyrate aminotransferase-like enzyme/Ser/Thr protein kinase RdoA (MazF antagonist)